MMVSFSPESTQLGMILEKIENLEKKMMDDDQEIKDDLKEIKYDLREHIRESVGQGGMYDRLARVEEQQKNAVTHRQVLLAGGATVACAVSGWALAVYQLFGG